MKKADPEVLLKLKEAYKLVLERANQTKHLDQIEWSRWITRKEYLEKKIKKFSEPLHASLFPKKVFISFSKKENGNGERYHDILCNGLKNNGFETVNGFGHSKEAGNGLVHRVLKEMKNSTVYVGIYTKEHPLDVNGNRFYSPSVWTIEEKGMALALRMPVLLICEKEIHPHYYEKTTGGYQHCLVESLHHFESTELTSTIDLISKKYYNELRTNGIEEDDNLF